MNRYRFKVWEWGGPCFNVLIYADNYQQAVFNLMVLYPDAPAVDKGMLIEGTEPLTWWDKLINFFRSKP